MLNNQHTEGEIVYTKWWRLWKRWRVWIHTLSWYLIININHTCRHDQTIYTWTSKQLEHLKCVKWCCIDPLILFGCSYVYSSECLHQINIYCMRPFRVRIKLQALVYDILPSTTAVFSYAIGSRKLSANEQFFFCWCSNSSKLVTNNSNYIRCLFYTWPCCLHQLK